MGIDSEGLQRAGEIVESSSGGFTAQCYQLYQAPPLGTLVKTSPPTTYAVVCSISTESLYPGRPVVARGEEEGSEQDIYRSNPQLERLLCTRFQAAVVGYQADGALVQALPPLPPHIHAFVYYCPGAEVEAFTSSTDFLRLLLAGQVQAADEIVSACLLRTSQSHPDRREFLLRAGKALALELATDLPRLNALLRRISA